MYANEYKQKMYANEYIGGMSTNEDTGLCVSPCSRRCSLGTRSFSHPLGAAI
jgi:hypothetical protein